MNDKPIMLTREGYDKLQQELEQLTGPKRRELAKDIGVAREMGDLSENAEYDAARDAQGMNEKRITEIENVLTRARILDDSKIDKSAALLGATVTVKDKKSGDEFDYVLVSEEESDFDQNKISITSPVGKAILGHKAGDEVKIKVPAGTLSYTIKKIAR